MQMDSVWTSGDSRLRPKIHTPMNVGLDEEREQSLDSQRRRRRCPTNTE